jgi:hypothetical protein
VRELREDPHATEGDAGAKAGGGLGDKTSATGAEDAEDLANDGLAVFDDEEEAGDDKSIDKTEGAGERMGVAATEGAIGKRSTVGAAFGAAEEGLGEVDAGGLELGKLLGEAAGVEAGAASDLDDVGAGAGVAGGKQGTGDLGGVIAEEVLAAESVEPATSLEEALRRTESRLSGKIAIAGIHAVLNLPSRWDIACWLTMRR